MMRKLALSLIALSLAAGPVLAEQTAHLNSIVASEGPVTLGDLFDVTGAVAAVRVAPAPRAGGSTILNAAEVQRVALQNGLRWTNDGGLRNIIVYSRLPASAAPAPAAAGPVAAPAAAAAPRGEQVLTWAHNLDAGEVIQAEDLTWAVVPRAPAGGAEDADDLIGKAAKRPLRAGSVASRRDVALPQVIKKDDIITITYAAGGVRLDLQAKAKGSASLGDNIEAVNLQSGKAIQAVASGPGRAVVGPEAQALRALAITDPSRLASR